MGGVQTTQRSQLAKAVHSLFVVRLCSCCYRCSRPFCSKIGPLPSPTTTTGRAPQAYWTADLPAASRQQVQRQLRPTSRHTTAVARLPGRGRRLKQQQHRGHPMARALHSQHAAATRSRKHSSSRCRNALTAPSAAPPIAAAQDLSCTQLGDLARAMRGSCLAHLQTPGVPGFGGVPAAQVCLRLLLPSSTAMCRLWQERPWVAVAAAKSMQHLGPGTCGFSSSCWHHGLCSRSCFVACESGWEWSPALSSGARTSRALTCTGTPKVGKGLGDWCCVEWVGVQSNVCTVGVQSRLPFCM